jgi:hypothetical protein
MSLREHESGGSSLMSLMVRRSPYLAIWRAKVTALDRAFFQVPEDCCCCDSAGICDSHATFQPTNDDDEVFLLQLEKNFSLKTLYIMPPALLLPRPLNLRLQLWKQSIHQQ